MAPIEIRTLTPDELRAASAILAHGMRDNPLHVAAFDIDPVARQRRLSRFFIRLTAYVWLNGDMLGAYLNGELIGTLGMMKPGRCRPGLMDTLRFAGVIVASNPPRAVLRIVRWLAAWRRNDPAAAHWHIGPLAVQPRFRRQGVGRRLMLHCCNHMDALGTFAYLETDREVNKAFYETLGFTVVGHELVLGLPNWFMIRPPMHGILRT